MPIRVRLVATAGPLDGRGHLGRVLSLAEADWPTGTALELELVRGGLTDGERARAVAVGLREVPTGTELGPDQVAVVDLPDPGAAAARSDPARLAVVDDRDEFGGSAALVVQPSQQAWTGPGTAAAVLAGYDYVPVPAAVRRRRAEADRHGDRRERARPSVLICFGGSDPAQVTARLVPALAQVLDAEIEAVIGASYRGSTEGWPVPVRRDPSDLVDRLAAADLAVLGAGTMKFEAACLARPMVLLAVADDQLRVGPAFASTGAARFLGDGRTIDPIAVADAIGTLLADRTARTEMGAAAGRLVDGRGADRIAAAIGRLAQPAARS